MLLLLETLFKIILNFANRKIGVTLNRDFNNFNKFLTEIFKYNFKLSWDDFKIVLRIQYKR
jgi:ATP-dependent Clp protease adapter protein ClpS